MRLAEQHRALGGELPRELEQVTRQPPCETLAARAGTDHEPSQPDHLQRVLLGAQLGQHRPAGREQPAIVVAQADVARLLAPREVPRPAPRFPLARQELLPVGLGVRIELHQPHRRPFSPIAPGRAPGHMIPHSLPPMTDLEKLRERTAELADLECVQMLLGWDQLVMMPAEGAEARSQQLGTLARLTPRTRPRRGDRRVAGRARGRRARGLDRDIVRLARRDWERARRVPDELAVELARAARTGQQSWQAARAEDDFAMFARRCSATWSSRARTGTASPRRDAAPTRRCSATMTSGCGRRSCGACSGRSPRRCRRWWPRRERTRRCAPLEVPVAAQQARGREHAAPDRRRCGELARGRLGAPLHRLDRERGHARHDPLQRRRRRVAAELAARVRPRPL